MAIRIKRKVANEAAMADFKAIAEKPNVDWMEKLHYHTRCAAEALTEIHGGVLHISINHRSCFVLIARQVD